MKLTEAQREEINKRRGESQSVVAKDYNVTPQSIKNIWDRYDLLAKIGKASPSGGRVNSSRPKKKSVAPKRKPVAATQVKKRTHEDRIKAIEQKQENIDRLIASLVKKVG